MNHKTNRWHKYANAGGIRKYYGIEWYVVDWSTNAQDFYNSHGGLLNKKFWEKNGITWNLVSSSYAGFCIKSKDFIYSSGSPTIFNPSFSYNYNLLGFLNSKVARSLLKLFNPTINTTAGDVLSLPFITASYDVSELVQNNIYYAKEDWDAHETSWDFKTNELIVIDDESFFDIVNDYCDFNNCNLDLAQPEPQKIGWRIDWFKTKWNTKFYRLHDNEEELNRQFIDIYGLQDELTPDVPLDEVTILQQGEISIENNEIVWHDDVLMKQLISYAIGCMMGRYRLDKPGLHIAHTDATREEIAPYEYNGETFEIDDDGIIPLMPKDCMFHDNAAQRLADFVRQVFGALTQIENLNFISWHDRGTILYQAVLERPQEDVSEQTYLLAVLVEERCFPMSCLYAPYGCLHSGARASEVPVATHGRPAPTHCRTR